MNVRYSVLLLHISPASVWQLQSRVPLRSLWCVWWAAGWRVVSSFFCSINWKSSRIIWEWIVTKLRQSTAMINISWLHFVRFFVATFCLLVWFHISLSWRRWVGSAINTFDPNTCLRCSKQGWKIPPVSFRTRVSVATDTEKYLCWSTNTPGSTWRIWCVTQPQTAVACLLMADCKIFIQFECEALWLDVSCWTALWES